MSYAALTAKYRPQTFAQVAGQDTLKTILSRASLEGKVAPAYLFSGTRGVGKTTLARIFAKALNCRTAPTAEPCNQCDQCRAVTTGTAVDVVEIDGASNRGIDDVRRLKEVVGYAPMEGRYKIFIIDEAHMLSREAFNALLKTLEEPPAGVTFIMATTEAHKFPATIISRCQHHVFRRLPENALVDHLAGVLGSEGVEFDQNAVRLIARRGAGSVRDAMSLLGQVLALGEGRLTEASSRAVLGLAGQDAFMRMIEAFRTGDTLPLCQTLRELLDQGLDMGFFLRELASLWRNMFILRQSGEAALPVVELPENEARACLEASRDFSLQHIHACWQMTLEGQRRVLSSLEPALALELLLLNLAMLPRLLSLENLSALGRRGGTSGSEGGAPGGPARGTPGGAPNPGAGTAPPASDGGRPHSSGGQVFSASPADRESRDGDETADPDQADFRIGGKPAQAVFSRHSEVRETATPLTDAGRSTDGRVPDSASTGLASSSLSFKDVPGNPKPPAGMEDTPDADAGAEQSPPPDFYLSAEGRDQADVTPAAVEKESVPAFKPALLKKEADWQDIFSLAEELALPSWLISLLRRARAGWQGEVLVLTAQDAFSAGRLRDPQAREALERLLPAWCGAVPALEIRAPEVARKSREELQAEIMRHPLVKEMQAQFGAKIVDYGQMR